MGMTWHLQPTRLTGRAFARGMSYESEDSPGVIAQVDLRSDGSAYIHATMSRSGAPITARMWRDLARQLRDVYGVTRLTWRHEGVDHDIQTSRV